MRVSHYLEMQENVVGGIREAVKNQRMALENTSVDVVTEPDLSADILHINLLGLKSFYYAIKASYKDVPVVINVHTTDEDFKESFRFSEFIAKPLYFYLKLFYSRADLLIAPSKYTADLLIEKYGFPSEKVKIVSNGIDTSKLDGFESIRQDTRDKYDLEGRTVFCVGSAFERKGITTFVEVARNFPEKDFVWFGKVFNGKVLGEEAREAVENPPENVGFTGYVDDIKEAYAAGDIFFYPTKVENQGIPVFEASHCSKPIVLRDIPAFEEHFEHEVNCLKAEDEEGFKHQLERLEDSELSEQLVKNARRTAEEHSLSSVGESLQAVYKQLIGRMEEDSI